MKSIRMLLLLLLALVAGAAHAQSRYGYLHKTVEEILEIQRKAMKPSPADVAAVASRACNTLIILLDKDPNFKKDIEALASASHKNLAFHRQLANDLVFFMDSFAPQEQEYLLKSGASPGASADILIAAALSRDALREPLSAQRLLANIEKLRVETCKGAKILADANDAEEAQQSRRTQIRKWALGLGGLSLIAADAVFAVPSGGVATASFTLGGAGVGAAVAP
ncbi:hypothetical protein RCH09_002015 [Actimicrobium sp. GrIS 1.19]|uniref:hypothetical protein n=1 Tax=Actimicrobium sp. GrIS 1.19 TaxID=3071708 RepID=UPI002DFF1076|nr:hypothetical protein [Actimicrobium sp. GrIS 1.19]